MRQFIRMFDPGPTGARVCSWSTTADLAVTAKVVVIADHEPFWASCGSDQDVVRRAAVHIAEVFLKTATLAELVTFYLQVLDLDGEAGRALSVQIGESHLEFSEAEQDAQPFYHFALLVPGNRLRAALEWIRSKRSLLADPATGHEVFVFDNWSAAACYFLDPAGNIVELIAHRGLEERSSNGGFGAYELIGFSELGVVCNDKTSIAHGLERHLEVEVWDGEIDDPRRLAFAGQRGRTLILCRVGRRWLPTGRPAEIHPVRCVLGGVKPGLLETADGPLTIVGRPAGFADDHDPTPAR